MKKFSLKALGAIIFAAGLVVAGVSPAQAVASLTSVTATSTSSIGSSGANATPIQIQATTATLIASNGRITVQYPTGWSIRGLSGACGSNATISGFTASSCSMDSSKAVFTIGAISASTQFTVTFAINNFNLASARDFTVTTSEYVSGAPPVETIIDTGTATLAAATPSYAIGYNSNGGTGGSMSATTSSGSLTLPANGFVKTGSSFAGWRVGNASSGTIYQPGDTVTITQAVLVYAQWTDNSSGGGSGSGSSSSNTLANTGFDAAPYLFGGLALALTGGALMLIARRKQNV